MLLFIDFLRSTVWPVGPKCIEWKAEKRNKELKRGTKTPIYGGEVPVLSKK